MTSWRTKQQNLAKALCLLLNNGLVGIVVVGEKGLKTPAISMM
jgi:hypothetical protein